MMTGHVIVIIVIYSAGLMTHIDAVPII
jgi:hypothetical protein